MNHIRLVLGMVATYGTHLYMWLWLLPRAGRHLSRLVIPGAAEKYRQFLKEQRIVASKWCAERAVSTSEVLADLGYENPADIEQTFPDIFCSAYDRIASFPDELVGGPGSQANLNLLYYAAGAVDARHVVETGVALGWSTLALLLAIRHHPDGALCSIDLPHVTDRKYVEVYVGAVVPPALKRQWTLFRMADRQGLSKALRSLATVDLGHYDSDKSYEGRAFGYRAIWQLLRPGGILISDDVGDNLAFKEFTEQVNREPSIIAWNGKYQGVLIK